MNKESFHPNDPGKNGATPPESSAASESSPSLVEGLSLEGASFQERRVGDRRIEERRTEERRSTERRDDAERRTGERRFLTMAELEADAQGSEMRRESGLWPSLDWRPGDNRMNQRRASERRIDDRRQEDRRKKERRTRGRRASDGREDLYHGQIELEEDIDDLFEAGEYKGSAD